MTIVLVGFGYTTVQAAGVALRTESAINFGSGLSATDDAASSRTNVSLAIAGLAQRAFENATDPKSGIILTSKIPGRLGGCIDFRIVAGLVGGGSNAIAVDTVPASNATPSLARSSVIFGSGGQVSGDNAALYTALFGAGAVLRLRGPLGDSSFEGRTATLINTGDSGATSAAIDAQGNLTLLLNHSASVQTGGGLLDQINANTATWGWTADGIGAVTNSFGFAYAVTGVACGALPRPRITITLSTDGGAGPFARTQGIYAGIQDLILGLPAAAALVTPVADGNGSVALLYGRDHWSGADTDYSTPIGSDGVSPGAISGGVYCVDASRCCPGVDGASAGLPGAGSWAGLQPRTVTLAIARLQALLAPLLRIRSGNVNIPQTASSVTVALDTSFIGKPATATVSQAGADAGLTEVIRSYVAGGVLNIIGDGAAADPGGVNVSWTVDGR